MSQNRPGQNRPGQNVPPTPTPTPTPSANSTISSSSSITTTSQTAVIIPPNAPAGGIFMTQPPQTSVAFYKIGPSQTVTFGWNFTALLRDSQSLTLSAICQNGNTYPVGPTNGILPGNATQVLWDLNAWQTANLQQPLPQGTCTLTIWDERGPTATPQPGFLERFDDLQFGLYTPQPYTAISDGWTCEGCRGINAGMASSPLTHPALMGTIVSFLVIFLSGLHTLRFNSR